MCAGEAPEALRAGAADVGKAERLDNRHDRTQASHATAPFVPLGRPAVAGHTIKAALKLSGMPLVGTAAAKPPGAPMDTSARPRPGQLHHRNISDGSVPVEGQHVELSPREEYLRHTMRRYASASGSGHTSRAGSRRPRDESDSTHD